MSDPRLAPDSSNFPDGRRIFLDGFWSPWDVVEITDIFESWARKHNAISIYSLKPCVELLQVNEIWKILIMEYFYVYLFDVYEL